MAAIRELTAEPLHWPLRALFASARRCSTVAENVLVEVRLDGDVRGWGEASPAEYVTGETAEGVLAAVLSAAPVLTGLDVRRVAVWADRLNAALPGAATARSAVEMALLDALTRLWNIPLSFYFGGAGDSAASDLTISLAALEDARASAAEAARAGFRALKVKVGGPDREADLMRVLAVQRAAPEANIRIDANQGFRPEGALAFVGQCLDLGVRLELVEQPVHRDDWDGLAAVTRKSPIPVIADEAVVDAESALRVAATGAADGINIKVAKAGLLGALDIVRIARAGELHLMLGCMLESRLGIAASLHLACGTGAFDYLDLDAHLLIGLSADGPPFVQSGDELQLFPELPGIGWDPDQRPGSG